MTRKFVWGWALSLGLAAIGGEPAVTDEGVEDGERGPCSACGEKSASADAVPDAKSPESPT
jgi:hypothetical protein